ncbi:electron transfer flavoprotein subunit beta/FixA family protein [Novosphingobium mangrovi (ex Hu et al. 2023)]|uniref:Electron transfer flavoprotein subunit beta/FixA family protein n=1 Tax=Novosphingobium mangrovi (ex Hu et al. 2023) TaxID=2930094 RepID=A0ABT0ACB9_9SPHN|nr:electron transfer flavoprotein subunit beta/FixA family protein [Novosphingobium mangrovi (ex Hu et al. 2023)]MCJ1960842.1 electron transfer flavoprotein subunit beta/FixA family protein [Novosphingobium mangrovi (ex Hu et al. 2023)]
MHIVVCIKQVPDSAQIRVHPVTNTIMRQGVPTIINPYDLFALEEALRLKDRLGATVTALCMGPPTASESLRKALTFGADRAVLLTDRYFAGSDTLATSYALSMALTKIGEEFGTPEIVFTGKQTIDGDTAQVGPGIASRLKLNQLTYISKIVATDLEAGRITVERRAETGTQVLATKLPVLITMLEATNEMRRGTIAQALEAARAEIITWNASDVGIEDLTRCGLRGSPTIVKKVFAPTARSEAAEMIEAEGTMDAKARAVVDAIFARAPGVEDDLTAQALHHYV